MGGIGCYDVFSFVTQRVINTIVMLLLKTLDVNGDNLTSFGVPWSIQLVISRFM